MDMILFGFDEEVNVLRAEVELLEPLEDVNVGRRRLVNRNENYFEETIPSYTIEQFKDHFRMSRATFENLLAVIANTIQQERNLKIPLEKQLLFSIWILSKPESFLAAGDRFGISNGNGHFIFKKIISALVRLARTYIQWPNLLRKQTIAQIFEARSHGIPGVVGVIDGCHIPCKQPTGNANDYYNRKGFHSIILQGVCDHKMRFIDIFVGMPGRMHDARVYRNSGLFRQLSNENDPLLMPDLHIIGDSAYPLSINMIVPFRDNGHLLQHQIEFNKRLSSIRSVIERTFGLLKGKFRRLQYLDISDFAFGNSIISAACVLHNFILNHEEEEEYYEQNVDDINGHEGEQAAAAEADAKRNTIAERFHHA